MNDDNYSGFTFGADDSYMNPEQQENINGGENDSEEKKEMNLSDELQSVFSFITNDLSKELPTLAISQDYFLLGVLAHKKNDLFLRLESCMTSRALAEIYNTWYQVVSSKAISAVKPNRTPSLDKGMLALLTQASIEARELGSQEVTSEHVFLAILGNIKEENKMRMVFSKAGLTYGILKTKMQSGKPLSSRRTITLPDGSQANVAVIRADSPEDAMKQLTQQMKDDMFDNPFIPGGERRKGKNGYITQYCTNLNDLAKSGKLDPIVGREKETNEIIRILGRKKKNNAILVGGEGVGKTVIGESIAWRIVNGDVPDFLLKKNIVSLDMTALMAGTTLRGMFEERVKGIIDNIKDSGDIILFIDNIGAVMSHSGKDDYDISAMLSTALENGDVQVIGTSDFNSFRKTFDKDPSLTRRFHKIIVDAPNMDESIKILQGLKPSYEAFHKVTYTDEAINACVRLANQYMMERNLPDSAIDLMDEIGSFKGSADEPEDVKTYRKNLTAIVEKIKVAKAKEDFETVDSAEKEYKELKQKYNAAKKAYTEDRTSNPVVITKSDVLDIVSQKTGIPVSNLSSDDKERLVGMDNRIKNEVVGQDEAIETICRALKRNRIGLHKGGCMYSCIEIGKTGVGKTLIAKKLAKELFGDENALVRFDMSEFSDKVSVNKLIGSNPGYVGYEEGGHLTEAIKNKKHCVLLLDEIEKADPEVYNIFLQVLDEGFLTDNAGMKVDFSNVIVIFTSNVGAKTASEFGKGIGFVENESENTKRILLKQLKNRFPPEFLNRIDDVIYFNALTDDNLKSIIRIELNKLRDNVVSIGYDIEFDDDTIDFLFDRVKEEKEYGARPIIRAIQDTVENKLTDTILDNDYNVGYIFKVSCCSDKSEVVIA